MLNIQLNIKQVLKVDFHFLRVKLNFSTNTPAAVDHLVTLSSEPAQFTEEGAMKTPAVAYINWFVFS